MAKLKTDRRDPHSMPILLRQAATAVLNLFVPASCLACDQAVGSANQLCGTCWQRLQIIEKPYCRVLGTPFAYESSGGESGWQTISLAAMAKPPDFDHCRSVVVYEDIARQLVHGLKFGDRSDLVPWMAANMVRAGEDVLSANVTIVPVPLHRWRMIKRRYNQSAELGRHIAHRVGGNFQPGVLLRIRSTRQQVGLGTKERHRNVLGAFRVPSDMQIHVQGRHVVLIDDVFTTGATLQACARALRRKGAAQVDCLTFARVFGGVAIDDQ